MGDYFGYSQGEDFLFEKTLSKETKKALAVLGKAGLLKNAYLAGGTACALQIGHRISIDLDFFTEREFDAPAIIRSLREIGSFELDETSLGTILGNFEKVKFSLFVYQYPILFPYQTFNGIDLADLRDIAAMKIEAISSRGIKRDFMDLYYICQKGFALKEILSFYDRKYKSLASNKIHLLKSLVYFTDADASVMPKMLETVDWKKVKKFFEHEVRTLV